MATHYRDVADQLRQKITQGSYENGTRLPAEDKLADVYGVSRPTLRLALEQLQNEGLLDKRHGSGNFVCWPAERLTYPGTARTTGWHGLNTNVSTVEMKADARVAALLEVEEGEKVTAYTYLARRGTRPRSLTHAYVPARLAALISPEEFRRPWGHDIRQQLTESGVQLASSTERLFSRLPTSSEARTLQISPRGTVLVIRRTLSDIAGQVVEGAVVILPGQCTEAIFTTHFGLRSDEGEPITATAEQREASRLGRGSNPPDSDKEVSRD
ncbi:GntR family transcriptional regulator [Streptomyces sp. WMMC500]|uniref:GntR family transcriptional regulator n=1 Tax=Streptomyces sp. WMMC500 TaxID=3015154 RepID=UPI00248CE773|nr:GntR family transcriptional regulator [Streptomyces sp. WMMC500]WBB59175.1 GntR family transcriptional regulator [Streptomyces sp. WMMC500]